MRVKNLLFMVVLMLFGAALNAAAQDEVTNLPRPATKGTMSLEEAIAGRRSEREFSDKALTEGQISQLLWAAQGETSGFKRAAPSAGSLYPMEVYLLTKEGFFHYVTRTHALETLAKEDLRPALSDAASGQASVRQAPAVIVIASVPARIVPRYGQRGALYAYIEAGHIAQNIHLQAVALGLVSVPVASFDDKKVRDLLAIPPETNPVYIIPVGYKGTPEPAFSTMGSY